MTPEEELLQFENDWNGALAGNNADDIGRFMSEDWVIIGTEGGITHRDDFLAPIRSGDLIHTRMETEKARVKIYGNSGIVTAKGTSAGLYKGEPFELYEWSTSVFIFREGKWLCVLTMLTPANKTGGF